MDEFLKLTISGLAVAGIFAVAASGLVLTYTATGIFNFAHGAIGMLGAFTFWQLHEWGLPTWLAVATVLLVLAPGLGLAIEAGIMRGLEGASEAIRIVVSVGLLAGMLAVGLWVWSPQESHPIETFWPGRKVSILGQNITWHQLFAFGVAIVVALGLRLLLYRTRAGVTMRATVDNRALAALNGARANRSSALAWAVGCSLAALAGILFAPLQTLSHTLLTLLIVDAYAAAVIGRLRSLPLTFLGAVIVGLAEAYGVGYLPKGNAYFSAFRPAIPVVILFIALLALPQSRLRGHRAARRREHFPRPAWRGALLAAGGVVLATAVIAPMLTDANALRATRILGLALIALSLLPLAGFAGQISLCQMSFAAIGAIVMAHLAPGGSPFGLIVAAVVAGAVGALVSLPALRLSGIYLALATAAFAVTLDRWVFTLPTVHVGPWQFSFFDLGNVNVLPLRLPGVDQRSPQATLVELAVAFALLSLLVVAVRRSGFGDRLLALKDSPAACATLGLDLTLTKLAVFTLSAAIAGVGGALYAGTLGSVSGETFNLFQSLPLLLVTVAGGLATPGGALFAGLTLGGIPIVTDLVPSLANALAVLPALIGITLGRSPNGVAPTVTARLAPLATNRVLLGVLGGSLVLVVVLERTDVIAGWGVFWLSLAAVVACAGAAAWHAAASARAGAAAGAIPFEWVGIERPFTRADGEQLDRALALPDRATVMAGP
jgi:branched-chain amino acid transport system permease protein